MDGPATPWRNAPPALRPSGQCSSPQPPRPAPHYGVVTSSWRVEPEPDRLLSSSLPLDSHESDEERRCSGLWVRPVRCRALLCGLPFIYLRAHISTLPRNLEDLVPDLPPPPSAMICKPPPPSSVSLGPHCVISCAPPYANSPPTPPPLRPYFPRFYSLHFKGNFPECIN